jgi:hypothetical protein
VQLLRNFPAIYRIRRFISVFTRALHWYLYQAGSIQYIPLNPVSLTSSLILSTHVRLGLPSGLFPSGFPTNILYAFSFFPIRTTCSAHLILLDPIILLLYLAKGTSYEAFIMWFSLTSRHFISLRSKYSHHPDIKHRQSTFLP